MENSANGTARELLDGSANGTAPEQVAVIGALLAANVIGLVAINRMKGLGVPAPSWSWETKRYVYWALIATLVTAAVALDVWYPIHHYTLGIKAYAFAFPVGLLDLWLSSTRVDTLKVLAGASLWCVCQGYMKFWLIDAWFERPVPPVIVTDFSLSSLAVELARFVTFLAGTGLLADLFFSPMHRLLHDPRIYQSNHKEHHSYINELTALVLFHGTLLDDFLMPATTLLGGFVYALLLSFVGLEAEAASNLVVYLYSCNILMSHAHDIRCARLMAPLPDELNFVAYHYVHHISPTNNFGLTEPSDMFWDWILGVSTIKKLAVAEAEISRQKRI